MAETMREQMARAMASGAGEAWWVWPHDGASEEACKAAKSFKQFWFERADEALAAMREPTEAMVRAMAEWRGTELMDNAAEDEVRHELTAYWRVATDAARNEQPDEEASNG
jgi:hypothetical protein